MRFPCFSLGSETTGEPLGMQESSETTGFSSSAAFCFLSTSSTLQQDVHWNLSLESVTFSPEWKCLLKLKTPNFKQFDEKHETNEGPKSKSHWTPQVPIHCQSAYNLSQSFVTWYTKWTFNALLFADWRAKPYVINILNSSKLLIFSETIIVIILL